jgi:carboxypeptidase family protein/TonB-dependent receptor-like protein
MSRLGRNCVLVLSLGLLIACEAFAQGGATGAITGTVQDPTGAVVAGADVTITNQDTGVLARSLKTDANGGFTAPLLPVGTYTVTVSSKGFQDGKFANIGVRVTETTRMLAKLAPLQVMEKIEVQAEVQQVETTSATTGQAIEAVTIRELPLATQNFEQLLTLSTGAQSELNASAELGRGNVRVIVNGQREDNNNYLIEGISATDYNVAQATNIPLPNPDVIQEFKVQTSLYDASQGRNSGGNMNAVLRSGTKQFHGDVYEFLRNDVFNANAYFLNRNGLKRPSVKQNIFGGSLGGPMGNAKLGFFFVNYQGTRQRSGLSPGTQISNPGFPVLPLDRSDAAIEAAFNVPSIDPVVHNLLNFKSDQFGNSPGGYLVPSIPGTPGTRGQFIISKPGKFTDDQFTTNWDKEFNAGKDKVSARFFFSDSEQLLPFGAGGLQASLGGTLSTSISQADLNFPLDLPVHNRLLTINETHLLSNTLVNDFRFGYNRIQDSLANIEPVGSLGGGTSGPLTAAILGIDRPTNNVTKDIYKFTLSSFQLGPTPFANQYQTQNNFNVVDNLSWVRGNHTWRFGGEFTRVNLDKIFPQVFNGQIFFVPGGGYDDFQNFLQGSVPFSFGGSGVSNHEYRSNNYGFFVQDDWKVRQNLTLNLGLRTEMFGAFYDKLCHIGNFDLAAGNSGQYPLVYGGCANKLNVAGLVGRGNDSTMRNNYSTTIGPRVGFAWDLFNDHKTSLRGGFGMYYVREDVGTVDQLSFQAPFIPIAGAAAPAGCLSTFFSANAPPSCDQVPGTNLNALPIAGTLDPGFVPCLGVLQSFSGGDTTQFPNYACAPGSTGALPTQFLFVLAVPRHYIVPSTQAWNLTLQRDLGKNWIIEVGYVGNHTIHLRETRTNVEARLVSATNPIVVTGTDGNTYTITENTPANGVARSNLQGVNGYGGMQIFANDAYSHYHSLQTTLSRRWAGGYFQAAYTFSKALDATSTGNTAFNTAWNDESDIRNSYGLSDFDRTHRFTVSYRYDLPFFSHGNGLVHHALGNWAISGITTAQSGTPFSVFDSAAGSAYISNGLAFPTLGASLAPGGSIAAGTTAGDIHHRIDGYLNMNNFINAPVVDPVAGTTGFGNMRRNLYRGPFQQNWDFSLIKNFTITERQQLRFTADFFNIWNHANFANPAATDIETTFCTPGDPSCRVPQSQTSFGKIVSTVGTPRLIQFSLRYAF